MIFFKQGLHHIHSVMSLQK